VIFCIGSVFKYIDVLFAVTQAGFASATDGNVCRNVLF